MNVVEIEIDFLESESYRPLFSVCDGGRLPAGVEIEPMFVLPRTEQAVGLRFVIRPGEALRFRPSDQNPLEGTVHFVDGHLQPVDPPPDVIAPRLAASGAECRLYWQRIEPPVRSSAEGAAGEGAERDDAGSGWRFALFDLEVEPAEGLESEVEERLRRLIEQGAILVDPAIAHPPPLYDPPLPKPGSGSEPQAPRRGR